MSVGELSRTRLNRMHDVMARHVDSGAAPGVVTAVSRRGEVHVDAIGTRTIGGQDPIRRDSIFRVSSMTKPVTAVAAMILVEECRLRLDEPIDQVLPELADRRVLTRVDGPLDDTVPARRPITLRDLLTFRLGLGQILAPPDSFPIQRAVTELGLGGFGPPNPSGPPAPDVWIERLGTLPLMCQPGDRWLYHTGSDILGVLIARVAGQPLEAFLRERIFGPLGMIDTGFSVPASKRDRFTTSYEANAGSGAYDVFDPATGGQWNQPPEFPSGGGGLVSTIDDYLSFGQMMLDGGRTGRQRVLSRPSIETMTTDQLLPGQKTGSSLAPDFFEHRGWGFGLAVETRRVDPGHPVGSFGWDGGLGTSWRSDPQERLVTILMTQSVWPSSTPPAVCLDFRTSAYQAIDD